MVQKKQIINLKRILQMKTMVFGKARTVVKMISILHLLKVRMQIRIITRRFKKARKQKKFQRRRTNHRKKKALWHTNDNDLPNAQCSKSCQPESDTYCFTFEYELKPKHDSNTCKWEKKVTRMNQ